MWIALVIAAQRFRTHNGYSREDDTDREKLLDYFRANKDKILQILNEHCNIMMKLARRRGTGHGNLIVDTRNLELKNKFSKLAAYYIQNRGLHEEELVETVGELLNKIRNNLFHGVKVYDDREDITLLELVNPILHGILQSCEFYQT